MSAHGGSVDPTAYERLVKLRWANIPHYYGDLVRMFFLGTALFMLVLAPFYADDLQTQLPFIVVGGVILLALAALTNPLKRWVLQADAVAAGVAAVIFELWALAGYQSGDLLHFVMREIPAVFSMFAFYYSLKTVRAMILDQIGTAEAREMPAPEEVRYDLADAESLLDKDGLGHPAAPEDIVGDD